MQLAISSNLQDTKNDLALKVQVNHLKKRKVKLPICPYTSGRTDIKRYTAIYNRDVETFLLIVLNNGLKTIPLEMSESEHSNYDQFSQLLQSVSGAYNKTSD